MSAMFLPSSQPCECKLILTGDHPVGRLKILFGPLASGAGPLGASPAHFVVTQKLLNK